MDDSEYFFEQALVIGRLDVVGVLLRRGAGVVVVDQLLRQFGLRRAVDPAVLVRETRR